MEEHIFIQIDLVRNHSKEMWCIFELGSEKLRHIYKIKVFRESTGNTLL